PLSPPLPYTTLFRSGYGLLAWLNMAAVLLLTPKVRKIVNDYDRQRKAGMDPTFDPKALGIEGAEWWETVFAERQAKKAEAAEEKQTHDKQVSEKSGDEKILARE